MVAIAQQQQLKWHTCAGVVDGVGPCHARLSWKRLCIYGRNGGGLTLQKMAETEERIGGLAPQKIRAERPEAFLKEPQGNLLGTLLQRPGSLRGIWRTL